MGRPRDSRLLANASAGEGIEPDSQKSHGHSFLLDPRQIKDRKGENANQNQKTDTLSFVVSKETNASGGTGVPLIAVQQAAEVDWSK
jgi:ssRNA-specific RNase YbeY (16S rRNA maturation enzyme)